MKLIVIEIKTYQPNNTLYIKPYLRNTIINIKKSHTW